METWQARSLVNARFFSSSPCFFLSDKILGESSDGGKIVNYKVFDPSTEQAVTTCKKKLPKKLLGQTSVGASQGWIACMEYKNLPVNLTDMYKPHVSSPRIIPLPPLGFYPTHYSTELSLSSSSPDQDHDFTVAAKFCGSHLSVCKPFWDSEWTHIETSLPLYPASDIMYSKRDKAFYFTSVKGLYMGSLHLSSNNNNNKLKYQQVRLSNVPKIPEAGREMLDQCFMSKHLVESPSGELFLVNW